MSILIKNLYRFFFPATVIELQPVRNDGNNNRPLKVTL